MIINDKIPSDIIKIGFKLNLAGFKATSLKWVLPLKA